MDMETSHADRVREHARREYIEPAKHRRESTIRIVAGDVQKALRLSNRVPLVCQALKSHKFLNENHLVLEKWEGPPSGMSTTVVFTYRLLDDASQTSSESAESMFLALRGIAKDVFQSLGGGEAFIRKEREEFYGPGKDQ
jgi:5-methylcytosine-specific restriction protein B